MTDGLQSHDTDGQIRFEYDGEPVGEVYWIGGEWLWRALEADGQRLEQPVTIKVDPDQSAVFIAERQRIALQPESIREPLLAELEGRLRIFRDETRPMAVMFGRSKSVRRGRERRSTPDV